MNNADKTHAYQTPGPPAIRRCTARRARRARANAVCITTRSCGKMRLILMTARTRARWLDDTLHCRPLRAIDRVSY